MLGLAQITRCAKPSPRSSAPGCNRLKGARREKEPEDHTFWALKDVCFEVGRGEVVGIVGRNGAGKSTLLKILSRIVEPTEGTARLRGRVASLLEVGTGFHPELSGRENIYLNGAILGMRKAEIDRKFDEIVAFSEIEKFLDTPVKRYSSGMYVRLAFAVAAHLEPEILIVDEVLAVGDFAFQKKCLGKMHDVAAGDGRTILFVSHNMSALSQLCERGILLEKGSVTTIGPIKEVIQSYLKAGLDYNTAQARFPIDRHKPCQYISAEILHGDGSLGSEFSCDEPVTIRLRVRDPAAHPQPVPDVLPPEPGRDAGSVLRHSRHRRVGPRAAGSGAAHFRDHDPRQAAGADDLPADRQQRHPIHRRRSISRMPAANSRSATCRPGWSPRGDLVCWGCCSRGTTCPAILTPCRPPSVG